MADLGAMRSTHQPTMGVASSEALAQFAKGLAPTEIPAYGTSLPEIIARSAPWRDWLEGAVLAGHVPHLEGIEIAVRGADAFTWEQIEESKEHGALGDAIGWTHTADHYRVLIMLLERLLIKLEQENARLHRHDLEHMKHGHRAVNEIEAVAADARAALSRSRLVTLSFDHCIPDS